MGRRSAAAVVLALVVASACSDSSNSAAPTTTTSTLTTQPFASATTVATPTSTASTASTTAVPIDAAALQSLIDGFADRQPVPFSIVVFDLAAAARAVRDPDRQVLSASFYKLFVARELLRRVHAGSLARDAAAGDGQGRTIDECLRAMIVVSDDPCGVAGLDIVGRGALDDDLAADGYVSTRLARPQRTSAADVALFLERARDGTLLGPGGEAAAAELYGLLRQQEVNDRLPAGLPPGTPIAHKTGDRTNWAHDAGVFTTPRGEVLLVVLSGPWATPCCHAESPGPAEAQAFGAIADLASEVYAAVTR